MPLTAPALASAGSQRQGRVHLRLGVVRFPLLFEAWRGFARWQHVKAPNDRVCVNQGSTAVRGPTTPRPRRLGRDG